MLNRPISDRHALWPLPIFGGLLVIILLVIQQWSLLHTSFGDTDDALRLVQVRDYLAGQGWYDLSQPRLNPPAGIESHWSRLIDAPLAALFKGLSLIMTMQAAEIWASIIWPAALFLTGLFLVALIAKELAGNQAANTAALLALVNMAGFIQFLPGRIDHHNVQILLNLLMLWGLVAEQRPKLMGAMIALSSAISLAIGMENLPILALSGVILSFLWALQPKAYSEKMMSYAWVLAPSVLLAYLQSPQAFTLATPCDVIGIHYGLPLLIVSLGFGMLVARCPATFTKRFLALCVMGAAALAAFALLNPRCLLGPYAEIDPRIVPIWLENVKEARPLLEVIQTDAIRAAVFATFALVVWGLGLTSIRQNSGNKPYIIALAFLTFSVLIGFWQVRGFSFATWLAVPVLAAWITHNEQRFTARWRGRLILFIVLNPVTLTMLTMSLAGAMGYQAPQKMDKNPCAAKDSFKSLAALPKGIVLANYDLGPFILASTHHSAVSGPYHRLGNAIYDTIEAFDATDEQKSKAITLKWKADYIIQCRYEKNDNPANMKARLIAAKTPTWLEEIKQPADAAYRLYRVKKP